MDAKILHGARTGNLYAVKSLFNEILNSSDHTGNTPLIHAARGGHVDVLRFLVERGAAVDRVTHEGASALYEASLFGHALVARLLLANGADVDQPNHDDESPLWVASSRGNCAVADVLLNGGAEVNRATRTGYTPLMIACRQNMIHVATLLCDRGANIEITDPFGYGPLAIASWYGNMEAVELLVRRGAKVNAKSAKGESPLFMAILCACRGGVAHTGDCRSVAVSRFLLAHGADPELSTADGTTPFSVVRQKQIPGIGELFDVLLLARLAVKCRGCDHHHGTARHRFIDDRNLTRAVAAFLKTSSR